MNQAAPRRQSSAVRLRAFLLEHRDEATVVLILLAALLVDLFFHAMLIRRWSPYVDENVYSILAQTAYDNPALRWSSLQDNKGPILTWFSFLPMQLGVENPLTAIRLVVVAAGAVAIAATGLITRHIADGRTALLTVCLLVISPLLIVHTSMGEHEPLVMAWAMLALLLQLKIAEKPRLDYSLLLGGALALGLLTKESGKLAVLLIPLSLLVFDWSRRHLFKRLLQWGGCITVALLVAWIGFSFEKTSADYYNTIRDASAQIQYHAPDFAIKHFGTIFNTNWPMLQSALAGYLSAPLLLMMAIGAGVWLRNRPRQTLLLLAWIVLPTGTAILIGTRPFVRYLLPAVPILILFIAIGIISTKDFAITRLRRYRFGIAAFYIAMACLFIPTVLFDIKILRHPQTVELPAFDDRELMVDSSSGNGCIEMANIIKEFRPKKPVVTAKYAGASTCLYLVLSNGVRNRDYLNVDIGQPEARKAQFVISNGRTIPRHCPNEAKVDNCAYLNSKGLKLVMHYKRPRGGAPLYMYRVSEG